MKRRFFPLALTLCLCFSLLPTALAAEMVEVAPPVYTSVRLPQKGGLLEVHGSDVFSAGVLDLRTGKEVLAPTNSIVDILNENLITVCPRSVDVGLVNRAGEVVLPAGHYYIRTATDNGREMVLADKGSDGLVARTGQYTLYNEMGQAVISMDEYASMEDPSEGLVCAGKRVEEKGMYWSSNGFRYGYFDAATGEAVIPLQYQNATRFRDGLALVVEGIRDDTPLALLTYHAYVIDKTGKKVAELPEGEDYSIKSISNFSEGIFGIEDYENTDQGLCKKFRLFDETGKEFGSIQTYLPYSDTVIGGLLEVSGPDGRSGMVNVRTGQVVVPMEYDSCTVMCIKAVPGAKYPVAERIMAVDRTAGIIRFYTGEGEKLPNEYDSTGSMGVDGSGSCPQTENGALLTPSAKRSSPANMTAASPFRRIGPW